MAMGSNNGPQINVTPMIDILLVLIITFMLLPHKSRGLDALVPQPAQADAKPESVSQDIVLTVEDGGTVRVDQDVAVSVELLGARLGEMFKKTARPVVFIRGKRDLAFEEVARVIDIAKGVGFNRVALMND
jgi:biopolymer transport protein TolR